MTRKPKRSTRYWPRPPESHSLRARAEDASTAPRRSLRIRFYGKSKIPAYRLCGSLFGSCMRVGFLNSFCGTVCGHGESRGRFMLLRPFAGSCYSVGSRQGWGGACEAVPTITDLANKLPFRAWRCEGFRRRLARIYVFGMEAGCVRGGVT